MSTGITVDQLCSRVTSGGTPNRRRSDYYAPAGIPWVKTAELVDGPIRETEEHLSEKGLAESSAKLLPVNTVLMAMYGATVGRLGWLERPAACNQAACAMIADADRCDWRWLYYALMWAREGLVGLASGAAQQNLNARHIRDLVLPDHDLATQQAIAEVLGALDDKIAANGRIIHLVDDLVEAQFELLAGGRGQVALAEIAVVNRSVTKPRFGGSLRYLDISSVGQGTYQFPGLLDWEEAPGRARRILNFGDTVWSTVRPNRRSHAIILDDDPLFIASTGLAVLSPKTGRVAGLYEASRREEFVAYLESVAEGSAYPAVRAERFRDAPVPDLSSEEWDGFETFALPMRRRAHAAAVESRHLAQTRDELLPLLMSGRVRVKDAEKTLEEVL